MSDEKIVKNKFGYPVRQAERVSSVKVQSRVAFKRPLSAAERVARAIKDHEYLKSLDSRPGDDTFDSPDIQDKAIHQLVTDPVTGEELTAGEYVMLQSEREQAHSDVLKDREARKAQLEREIQARRSKKRRKDVDDSEDGSED